MHPLTQKILTIALILMLGLLSLACIMQLSYKADDTLATDFGKLYESGRLLLQKKNPYAQIYVTLGDDTTAKRYAGNLNPPAFQLLFLPFAYLDFKISLAAWTIMSIICGLISLMLLIKALNIYHPPLYLILSLIVALFSYFATFTTLVISQVTLVLLPLTVGAWLAAKKQRILVSGALLGIAASLKLFFGLFILYFLLRREWRAFIGFFVAFVVCISLSLIPLGIPIYKYYQVTLHNIWWYSSSWNGSLYGFSIRLLGGEKNVPLFALPQFAYKFYLTLTILLLMSLIKFLWPNSKINFEQKLDLDFSIILVAMLLISPLGWSYYFTLLIIPVAVLLKFAAEKYHSIFLHLVISSAVILGGAPYSIKAPYQIVSNMDIFWKSQCYFYALILLLGLLFFSRKILMQNKISTTQPISQSLLVVLYIIVLLPSNLAIIQSTSMLTKEKSSNDNPIVKIVGFGN